MILDLSENPGGQTKEASRLLSYFLPKSHQIAKKVYRKSRVQADKSFLPFSSKRMKQHKKNVREFRKVRRKRGRYTLNVRRRSFGHPSYKGKLTVLVSPLTHSAATMVALTLKQQRKATVIGYPGGGSTTTSCFAAAGTYALPISKIEVIIPETCFLRSRSGRDRSKRLVPDIEVSPLARNSNMLLGRILRVAVKHSAYKPTPWSLRSPGFSSAPGQ